jgi:hypothetical protein
MRLLPHGRPPERRALSRRRKARSGGGLPCGAVGGHACALAAGRRSFGIPPVQIHEEALAGKSRPCAPGDCVKCAGKQKLHKHRTYQRNANPTGQDTVAVHCFRCPRCDLLLGIIPAGMLPYRSVPVARLEDWLDARHEVPRPVAGEGARPPPASEVERGCVQRAEKKLLGRIPFLRGCLGQMLPMLDDKDLGGFWRALRMIGRLGEILLHLAAKFKTSLLACYRSLRPRWARDKVPA